MSFNLTTSSAIIRKAGYGANSTIVTNMAALGNWCDQAEAQFSALTRRDWLANSLAITTNFRSVIEDAVSDIAATKVILYDMAGYRSRLEAQTILDGLRDNYMRIIEALKEQNYKDVLK